MIGQILNQIILSDQGIKDMIAYTNSSGLTAYAFTPNIVPQGVPLPAVSYKVLSIDSIETKDGFSGIDKYRIQVDLFASYSDYGLLNDLDSKIRKTMAASEGIFTVTRDGTEIQVDVGVSHHDETTEVFFDESNTHGRSTEYFIITNS